MKNRKIIIGSRGSKLALIYAEKARENILRHAKDFGYFNMDVKSNWKFAIENYCESYHLPWIHQELNKVSNI